MHKAEAQIIECEAQSEAERHMTGYTDDNSTAAERAGGFRHPNVGHHAERKVRGQVGVRTLAELFGDNGGGNGGFTLADTDALPDANGHFGSFLRSNVAFYLVDSGHGFFAETDLVNPGSGQVAVGYFEVRTPVCDGCQ